MQARLYDHILGSLAVAGMGDAMGAATEQWSTRDIYAHYGGPVRAFYKPPPDTFSGAEGNELGQITDDTSQMYYLAQTLIDTDGNITTEAWVDCLLRWADESPHVGNMGPTTRLVVEALRTGGDPYKVGTVGTSNRQTCKMGATNGAAMRVAPAGLVNPGDIEGACRDALTTCLPSHNTQVAISSACAVAAGVAQALTESADVFSVARACLAGARRGEELAAEEGRLVAGPSVLTRIELAMSLALKATSLEEAMERIEAYIGNSVDAAESVPAAIGLFVFAGGDPIESIVAGTNIGNDTDTIAAMAGALAGALRGFSSLPPDFYATFKEANEREVNLDTMAQGITDIALRRLS
jgi:ADP-ribosylglycohydrolase